MAIHEIRETISGSSESTNGQIIVQRKINLQPGKRHTIAHLDWFDDAISGGSAANAQYKMEVFLTNYPLVLTTVLSIREADWVDQMQEMTKCCLRRIASTSQLEDWVGTTMSSQTSSWVRLQLSAFTPRHCIGRLSGRKRKR